MSSPAVIPSPSAASAALKGKPNKLEMLRQQMKQPAVRSPEINEILAAVKRSNTISLRDAETRNIIFVGRSRCGKTTALHVMRDPTYLAERCSMFSDTVEPDLFSFTVNYVDEATGNAINYNINIIDTPGLFEIKPKDALDGKRENAALMQLIVSCLDFEVTNLSCIFFVCEFKVGINQADIEAFEELLKMFKGAEGAICMLITHAEKFSEEDKQHLRDEIRQHEKLRSFLNLFEDRIFFTGAVNAADYNNGLAHTVNQQVLNVHDMRDVLYQFVFKSKGFFPIASMKFFSEMQLIAQGHQAKLFNLQEELLKLETFNASHAQYDNYNKMWNEMSKLKGFFDEDDKVFYEHVCACHKQLLDKASPKPAPTAAQNTETVSNVPIPAA